MRILVLSINYWPEETGIGAFTTYRCEYLAAAGHDVTVCTTFPYYPQWEVPREYRGRLSMREQHNGVEILRSWSYVPKRVSSIKRVLHEGSFVASTIAMAIGERRPDLIFVISPPLGLTAAAIALSRMWRVPYVFDVEDLQPDAAADLGMLPPWALKLMYRVEAAAYRNAALVSTITEGMRGRIVAKGIEQSKVVLFEPRADEELFDITNADGRGFRRRYGLEGKFVITHSGNMGVKQGLDVIVEAAAASKDPSLVFLLVGDGADRKRIESRANSLQLSNVRFLPLLDRDEFRQLLSASDVCLVTQQPSVSDIVFPSKTVTYFAAGRPVIASVNEASEVARAIRISGAGAVVTPENPAELLNSIAALRSMDLGQFGERGRDYARRHWSEAAVLSYLERTLVGAAGFATESAPEVTAR